MAWDAHLKGKRHVSKESSDSRKVCEICDIEIVSINWNRHLKSKTHLKNSPEKIL